MLTFFLSTVFAATFSLKEVANGFRQITDAGFIPGDSSAMLMLQKTGELVLSRGRIPSQTRSVIARLPVLTSSEEGLLGLAFSPAFQKNRKLYLSYVLNQQGRDTSRISEWVLPVGLDRIEQERVLLEVVQPYANHNGGKIAFGPDGMLYIGLGDGGSGGDPLGHGQNCRTLLGSMLRISVEPGALAPYIIPKDNPFADGVRCAPETWAYGLRNPWRFSFTRAGDLIAADVGQNAIEEIDVIERGKNYGWNLKEGTRCYRSGCDSTGLTDPILEYGRTEGSSITGGFVMTSPRLASLQNKYIFGDYGSGRIWAADLSARPVTKTLLTATRISPATFIETPGGDIWVTDFSTGKVFELEER